MRHNRLTLDELFEELRTQGVTDIKDREVRHSGDRRPALGAAADTVAQPADPPAAGVCSYEDDVFLPTVIINDGRLHGGQSAAGRDITGNGCRRSLPKTECARPLPGRVPADH